MGWVERLGQRAKLLRHFPNFVVLDEVDTRVINGEFTDDQLDQIPLFLLFYAGAGNCTALFRGIEAAKARFAAMK